MIYEKRHAHQQIFNNHENVLLFRTSSKLYPSTSLIKTMSVIIV